MSTRGTGATVPRPSTAKQPTREPASPAPTGSSPTPAVSVPGPSSRQSTEVEPGPVATTLADIQKNLQQFSTTINGKLDRISEDVNAMKTKFDELESSVKFNSDKIIELEKEELPKMKSMIGEKFDKYEEKLILLEIHNRKSNLLFYGVEHKQGEDIYAILTSTFINLGIEEHVAKNIALANAHRLPRRNASAAQGPTPIIARFCYMRERDLVLGAFENQQRRRGTPGDAQSQLRPRITVRTDLPPTLKIRRGILASAAYKLRKERGLSTKISVQGAQVILQWKEKGSSNWHLYKD